MGEARNKRRKAVISRYGVSLEYSPSMQPGKPALLVG
jgi:hypothetical protein